MIITKLKIGETEYVDSKEITISKTSSGYGSTGKITMEFDNPLGRHKADFSIGEEIGFWAGNNSFDNLVSFWKFDDQAGTTAHDEIGSNNGTIVGATFTNGKIGTCLNFINDYVQVTNDPSINFGTGDFSIGLWIKTSSADKYALTKGYEGEAGDSGYQVYIDGSGKALFRPFQGYNSRDATSTTSVNDNAWHHIIAVRENGYSKIYVDGNLESTSTQMELNTTYANNLFIGNWPLGGYGITGLLDEVRIYNKALSQAEITDLYNSGSGTDDKKMFCGIVDRIEFRGFEADNEIIIKGKDYMTALIDSTVEPEIYTNKEVSVIVKDIIDKYVIVLTRNNVGTTAKTLDRISFSHTNIHDALKRLGELSGYIFYVDVYKDLHFIEKESQSSGRTFNRENILRANWSYTRDGIANKIWVYGDRMLTAASTETLGVGSGAYQPGGSVYYLTYEPHNIRFAHGQYVMKGWIEGMGDIPPFYTQYLVNFWDKKIVTLSGTNKGDFINMASGETFTCDYDRSVPIVKMGDNTELQNIYKPISKVVIDREIKDPDTAKDRLALELTKGAEIPESGSLEIKGFYDMTPGQTAIINISDFGISNYLYEIINIEYRFNKKNNLSEKILTIDLNQKKAEITDKLREMAIEIANLKGADVITTDLITRSIFTTGSIVFVGSRWNVETRNINDTWIADHPMNGGSTIYCQSTIGSLISGCQWASGNIGYGWDKAIQTGSPAYAVVNSNDPIFLSGGTISLWAKPIATTSGTLIHAGVTAAPFGVNTKSQVGIHLDSGMKIIGEWADGAGDPDGGKSISSIPVNEWTHVALGWSKGSNVSNLYVNGSLQAGDVFQGNNKTNWVGSIFIGRSIDGARFFSGLIDDVRIYDYYMGSEVGSLANKVNLQGGLKAYWKMDEDLGSYIYNSASIESKIPISTTTWYGKQDFNISGNPFIGEGNTYYLSTGSGMGITTGDLGGGSCLDCGSPSFASGGLLSFQGFGLVSMWIKPKTNNSSGALFTAPARDLETDDFNRMYIRLNQRGSLISYYVGDGSPSGYFYSNMPFENAIGKWTHVAIVNNVLGSKSDLYIDGKLDKSTPVAFSGACYYSYNYNLAGGSPVVSWYSGLIDEFRIVDYSGIYTEPIDAGWIGSIWWGKTIQPLSGILFGDRRSAYSINASGGYYM